jgi:hypothetical protein
MPFATLKKIWTSTRRIVRFFRIAALLSVLAVVGFLFYWNQAGLPGFLKDSIQRELASRGIELNFQKIRFRWDRGIVAEKVQFGRAQLTYGPRLTADEIAVGISPESITKWRIRVDKLQMRGGHLQWNFSGTDQPTTLLALENINAQLLLNEGDCWQVNAFDAQFYGANLHVEGILTNASYLQNKIKTTSSETPAKSLDAVLRRFTHALTNWNFSATPAVQLKFTADATNLASFKAVLDLTAPEAKTPFGQWHNFTLTTLLAPNPTNADVLTADIRVRAGDVQSPWGNGANLVATTDGPLVLDMPTRTNWTLTVEGNQVTTRWGSARGVSLKLNVNGARTNLLLQCDSLTTPWAKATKTKIDASLYPLAANSGQLCLDASGLAQRLAISNVCKANTTQFKLNLSFDPAGQRVTAGSNHLIVTEFSSPWVQSRWAEASLVLSPYATNAPRQANGDWAGWARLEPFPLQATLLASNVQSQGITLDRLKVAGHWSAPELAVAHLDADLLGGNINVSGRLNVATRQCVAKWDSDIDPAGFGALLGEQAQSIFKQIQWNPAPTVTSKITCTLPPWVNRATNWPQAFLQSLFLDSAVKIGPVSWRGFSLLNAESHVLYSNATWRLPDLVVHREDGHLQISLSADEKTREFACHLNGTFNPNSLKPLLPVKVYPTLDEFRITMFPYVEGEITGAWDKPRDIAYQGRVRLTNFVFRKVEFQRLDTGVIFSNNVLSFPTPALDRAGNEHGEADSVVVDFNVQKVYLNNARGIASPMAVAQAVGPHVIKILEPYRFANPVTARADGIIPMHGEKDARIRFDVKGGPFEWWRFHMPEVQGTVWWIDNTASLTNMAASFYGGKLTGNALFGFGRDGADVEFAANFERVNFQAFMADVGTASNKLEGTINGLLVITRGNTEKPKDWFGYGAVTLHDGLIWELPVFGIFSPVLNSMAPGLGNTRATGASADFFITNSVIHSSNLDIQAQSVRMLYQGTVDFDYRVNARVEAELSKDYGLVGRVVNLVLTPFTKAFEYKVTGTLMAPKSEPLYLPAKIIMFPLHPFQNLKKIFAPQAPVPNDKSK